MSFYVSTATFFLLHCDEWDRVVALPRYKFVTGATLLQLGGWYPWGHIIHQQIYHPSDSNEECVCFITNQDFKLQCILLFYDVVVKTIFVYFNCLQSLCLQWTNYVYFVTPLVLLYSWNIYQIILGVWCMQVLRQCYWG